MAYWLAWQEPRAVGDLVHVGKFFARNLGGLIRARTFAGPAREGKSRTPSMYAGEKSDEVVVPRKRPNKGRQLPAEVVEGRASPEGNSRQAAVVRTLSRAATSIRLAAVRRSARGFKPCAPPTFDPREEPGLLAVCAVICTGGEKQSLSGTESQGNVCRSPARRVKRGGWSVEPPKPPARHRGCHRRLSFIDDCRTVRACPARPNPNIGRP